MLQVTGGKRENRIVLTKPATLEGEQVADYAAPNPLQLVLSLFKNVMPGSDLTRFQASTQISSTLYIYIDKWEDSLSNGTLFDVDLFTGSVCVKSTLHCMSLKLYYLATTTI